MQVKWLDMRGGDEREAYLDPCSTAPDTRFSCAATAPDLSVIPYG